MGVGNFLSIRAHESAREAENLPEEEASPVRHAVATFLAFVTAGVVPLLPYVIPGVGDRAFVVSAFLTLATLFAIGAARAAVTVERWWRSGLEMFTLGALVAVTAYFAGAIAARVAASL
jgi:VIT1/CCC1 family predicted Fe2+/Mn2+ transporter